MDTNNSYELVAILVPIIVTPLCAVISWIVRGFIENNNTAKKHRDEEIRRYLIDNVSYEISNFYWPLYINLVRYKKLTNRYLHIKSGTMSSFSQSESVSTGSSINVERELKLLEAFERVDTASSSRSSSDDMNKKEMPQIESGNIRTLENFSIFLQLYEKNMHTLLLKIQTIYTQHATHASFSDALFDAILKLDEYITYVTTVSSENLSESFIEKRINCITFPDSIYVIVEKTLHELQAKHNNLLYNHHNCIMMDNVRHKSIFRSEGHTRSNINNSDNTEDTRPNAPNDSTVITFSV